MDNVFRHKVVQNPQEDAEKPEKRPITLNTLRLLSHNIATRDSWSEYKKYLRWAICLLAFWGSFRIGKLLERFRHKFNSNRSLMPSDIQFHKDCVAVWLRTPKVETRLGDVVEVWKVEQCKELDPVAALETYMAMREEKFGRNKEVPVFIHEDGLSLTKARMNTDLKSLLAEYPEIAESKRTR